MKFYAGGEFFYNPELFFKKRFFYLNEYVNQYQSKSIYFTGGGIFSIYAILNNIKFNQNGFCLLPSYLCPTILYPFKELKIKFVFYRIDEKLNIDFNHIEKLINHNCKAFFFINYFGFLHPKETLQQIDNLKERGIIIIEDASQNFFTGEKEITGDFFFNSFRKYLPINGSMLVSSNEISVQALRNHPKHFLHKNLGQIFRYLNYKTSFNLSKFFLHQFKQAEREYYKDYSLGFNAFDRYLFERTNFQDITNRRRKHFNSLLNEFGEISLYKKLPDNIVPLGFPILAKKRDEIRNKLIEDNIFCPVHWRLPDEITDKEFNESTRLSKLLLTLPVSENIQDTIKYMDKLKKAISGHI